MAGLEERGSVPVPDPTKLTTESVAAAKIELEKLFDTKMETIKSDIANFRLLVDEKFTGRQTALDAALKSANELVKQQNESNALAAEKAEKATTKQIDLATTRIDDLKERIADLGRKDWATVGAYIVGAVGIAALIIAAVLHH